MKRRSPWLYVISVVVASLSAYFGIPLATAPPLDGTSIVETQLKALGE
jgi:hypothetical protein